MELKTKKDYIDLLESIIKPIIKYYDEENSKIIIPNRLNSRYSNSIADFESFSRPLWGLSFIKDDILTSKIFNMIKNGSNPKSKLYWGNISNNSQMIVELVPVLFYIYCNKEYYEKSFTKIDKENLNNYFYQINNIKCFNSNWLFFPILINTLLKVLNLNYNEDIINKNFKLLDKHYIGDGFYYDNDKYERDYYNSYSFHFYSLLYIYLDDNSIYKDKIIERSNKFLNNIIYFYSNDGSNIPFGRSLIYRFATVSFFSAYILNNLYTKDNISIIKGIINRNINYFLTKDIYNIDNTFNIGYIYQNQLICEYYNSTSSTYWCLKSFIFLLLNEDNLFYKVNISNINNLDNFKYLKNAQFILTRNNNNIFLYPINLRIKNNVGNSIPKYERLVYSNTFGFNLYKDNTSLKNLSFDNTYAIYINNCFIEKHNTLDKVIDNKYIVSIFNPVKEVYIKSYIIPFYEWNIRIIEINTKTNIMFYDFGYSINRDNMNIIKNKKEIILKNDTQVSSIKNIIGNGVVDNYETFTNTNILYPRSNVVYTSFSLKKGNYLIIDSIYGSDKIYEDYPNILLKDNKVLINYKEYNYSIKINNKTIPKNYKLLLINKIRNIKNMIKKW